MQTLHDIINKKINKEEINIILLAHVEEPLGYQNQQQIQCARTERFSIEEFYEIYSGIVQAGYFIKSTYFNEIDFIESHLKDSISCTYEIIFNLARNGKTNSKKALIPAFCDLIDIPYTTSSSFSCSLARDKVIFGRLLESHNLPTPKMWENTYELKIVENKNTKIIKKPISESASQGIYHENIFTIQEYLKSSDLLDTTSNTYFYQEYIDGYECEVPIFKYENDIFCLDPVGINLKGNDILTFTTSSDNDYDFFDCHDYFSNETIEYIKETAIKVFKLLDLDIYGRVDFRVTKDGKIYVFDISTTPYITKHSSFAFAINQIDLKYEDIFDIIIKATNAKFHILK